jgi:ubiquinone/menaquinone biosynthesis C-methylase UbiE
MKKTNGLRDLWYKLSIDQRFLIRRLYYLPVDLWDKISGKTIKYVAPRGAIYTGSPASAKDYVKQGEHQLDLLKEFIALKPDDHILDIGSGIGRTAIALAAYLNPAGKYEGFDAVKKGVDWCNLTIGKDFPNFTFTYIPLSNDLYNDSGIDAVKFVFPYEDNSFDKAFLFSVFTHMQIEEIQNYLKEIERILKPGGMCLATLFIYNPDIENYISENAIFSFPVSRNGYKLMNEKVQASNIAISEEKLHEMIAKTSLTKTAFIDGYWKDQVKDKSKVEYQDILVLKK